MSLKGCKVVEVREMTDDEYDRMGWMPDNLGSNARVLVLDDGTILFPSQDPEGNGAGAFLGVSYDELYDLEGETISHASSLTDRGMEMFGWDRDTPVSPDPPLAIAFEDGPTIAPSRDPEGNGPGELFGFDDQCEDDEFVHFHSN